MNRKRKGKKGVREKEKGGARVGGVCTQNHKQPKFGVGGGVGGLGGGGGGGVGGGGGGGGGRRKTTRLPERGKEQGHGVLRRVERRPIEGLQGTSQVTTKTEKTSRGGVREGDKGGEGGKGGGPMERKGGGGGGWLGGGKRLIAGKTLKKDSGWGHGEGGLSRLSGMIDTGDLGGGDY